MEKALNLKTFRESVEAIDNDSHRTLVQTLYLLAARESEVCTRTDAERIKRAVKPLGNFLQYSFADYQVGSLKEKVLLITVAVAKRTKLNKEYLQKAIQSEDKKVIEDALWKFGLHDVCARWKKGELELTPKFIAGITGKLCFKTVGIPLNPKYEPWSLEILKYIRREGLLKFYITDRAVRKIVAKYLKPLLGWEFSAHKLKHARVTHLITYYNFDPYEVSSYAGWSLKTVLSGIGLAGSPMLDVYAHLTWRKYFPKLLVPLEDLLLK